MKRVVTVLAVLLILPTAAGAYYFTDYSADVHLGNPVEHSIRGQVFAEETLNVVTLTVPGEPNVKRARLNGQPVETRVESRGNSHQLILKTENALQANTTHSFEVSFTTPLQTEQTDRGTMYTSAVTPERRIESYRLTVTLPDEAFIAFENNAPLISPTADMSTDGQQITLEWETSLDAGESFTALVVYKQESSSLIPLVGGGLIIALLAVFLSKRDLDSLPPALRPEERLSDEGRKTAKEDPDDMETEPEKAVPLDSIRETLKDSEEKILDIIISYDGKAMQKDVVRELDFSKSKVSKVIRGLEVKGILEKKPYGRTNRLVIADKYKWDEPGEQ